MAKDTTTDLTGQLTFEGDRGAGRSKWIAILLALCLIGWMGSGYVIPAEAPADAVAEEPAQRLVTVAVAQSVARDVPLVLTAEGQSTPDRSADVRSEAGGQIAAVMVGRGDLVVAGQELARVDDTTQQAQLMQAESQLTQARAQFDQADRDLANAIALQDRGIATEDRVTQARAARAAAEAAIAAAEAAVTGAQEQIDNTRITAPFAGRLNSFTLDAGEFVSPGDVVAEVLDNDPLTVVVQVPQQALSRIARGQAAEVSFITGETLPGTVGFIGANADSQTRTFRVEVAVDNPDSVMPAGLSARIAIPTGMARGHFISPAILSLDTSGELGVKTVEEGDVVGFAPIAIVRAQTDGIWVTGLPDEARIITVGQGYVNAGDRVDPRVEGADEPAVAVATGDDGQTTEASQ